MLGSKLSRLAASAGSSTFVRCPKLRSASLLSTPSRSRNVSWKAAAAVTSNRGGSSKSSSRDSRDSRDRSPRRWDSSSNRSSTGTGTDRRGDGPQHRSSTRPQQQQHQQRQPWQEAAARDDSVSWKDHDDGGNSSYYDSSDDAEYRYPTRPSKASYREQLFGEALYGVAPILAALKAGRRTAHQLLMQEGLSPVQRKDARALQEIQKLVQDKGTAVRTVSKHELNMLAGNRPHQGLVLDASPLQWDYLEVFTSVEELQQQLGQVQQQGGQSDEDSLPAATHRQPVWLALDEVMDPQNLGAMIRSAYCLGVSGILACSRNCSPLTPVVSKASAGAAELMTLHSCRSMPRTLADAASKGWAVVGAAAEADAVPVSQFQVETPTILVMGNEGYGLRQTVKRCCTQLVQIEMAPAAAVTSGSQQLVDSLNVSVATGILLHQLIQTARRR